MFVVRDFRMAKISDSATQPTLNLELVTLGGRVPATGLRPSRVAIVARIRADSVEDCWYRCIVPNLQLYVGAHPFIR